MGPQVKSQWGPRASRLPYIKSQRGFFGDHGVLELDGVQTKIIIALFFLLPFMKLAPNKNSHTNPMSFCKGVTLVHL